MEHNSLPVSRNLSLKQLVADALVEIERLGYSRRSRNRYRVTWKHLLECARRNDLGDEFSEGVMAKFIEEYHVGSEELGPGEGWRQHLIQGARVLTVFAANGYMERASTDVAEILGHTF